MRNITSIKILSFTILVSFMMSLFIINEHCFKECSDENTACCQDMTNEKIDSFESLKSQNCCEFKQHMDSDRSHIIIIAQKIKHDNLPSLKSNTVIFNSIQDHNLVKSNLFSFSGGEHLTVLRI